MISGIAEHGIQQITSPSVPLEKQEVHLWYISPREVADSALLGACHELLSPKERARHVRFVFQKGRREYLITRALVRIGLASYSGISPFRLAFTENSYGRPEVLRPTRARVLRFSVSHTNDLIACLFGLERDIGLDVEDIRDRSEVPELADRFFSPAELRDLRGLTNESRQRRFFEYWTLKEAYIKARGMGLSLPLDGFFFRIDEGRICISFAPCSDDDPERWQFSLLRLTERHQAAVAIRRGSEENLAIRLRGKRDFIRLLSRRRGGRSGPGYRACGSGGD